MLENDAHTQVKQLAGDTKLDRKQVLAWLKERVLQPNTCAVRF